MTNQPQNGKIDKNKMSDETLGKLIKSALSKDGYVVVAKRIKGEIVLYSERLKRIETLSQLGDN